MNTNRPRLTPEPGSLPSQFIPPLPTPPAQPPAPGAFFLCPFAAQAPAQLAAQQALYQWAWEQAQAVVRPSLPERDLLGVWN